VRSPEVRLYEGEIIVDNFAGGGGASTGIEWALGRSPDIAINHDAQAVAMHEANHPTTKHFVEDVWDVDPVKACAGRKVGLAWFSPDCKHFSKAKGGKPVSKKIRGLAWIVVKWAKVLKTVGTPIRVIALENVEEFQTWGPLGDDDRPDKLKKGLTFQRWKKQLENLGYKVEFREIIAADYGAPTTRKRLFLIARCDGRPIVWPKPTHDQHGRYGLPKWRAAAECIDWSLPCHSIFLNNEEAKEFKVKRPLAPNTMKRIYRGLMKFVIENPKPFIVGLAHGAFKDGTGGMRGRSIEDPLTTIHAGGKNFAIVAPHVAKFRGDSSGSSVESPLPTITAGPAENPAGAAHAMAVVSAGIVPLTHQGGDRNESTDEPMRTITGAHRGEKALAQVTVAPYGFKAPFVTEHANATNPRSWRADEPLRTQCAEVKGGHFALVAPVLAGAGGPEYSGKPTSIEKPMGTLVGENHKAVIGATLIQTGYGEREGQAPRAPGLDKPLGTVVAGGAKHALVAAFMAQHNGGFYDERGGAGRGMEQPVSTITNEGSNQNLVAANLVVNTTGHSGSAADSPAPTITTGNHHAVVASSIMKFKGTSLHGKQMDLPLDTVQAEGQHYARADAFMIAYYGNEKDGQPVDEAMRTLTARDRLGLVKVEGDWYRIEDIGMRMLVPRELYTAQGFPTSYKIAIPYNGKPLPKDAQVRMCGNSVSPYPCAALVAAQFAVQEEELVA
jgi:DNA (cytosine-5)-methyltransferase 1